MRALFIINLYAGKKTAKNVLWEDIERLNTVYDIEVYITKGKYDAYRVVKERALNFDIIIVSGGDGTIHEVTCALLDNDIKVPLAVYPSGTVNDFCAIHGLNRHKANTDIILKDQKHYVDMGSFNDTWFDYVAGFGAFCDVSYSTSHKDKEAFGPLAYIVKGLSGLSDLKPIRAKIIADDGVYENDYMFGLVLLGHRAAGIDIYKKEEALCDDGYLDVILIEYTPNILELYNYLIGILGSKAKYVVRFKTKELTFTSDKEVKWTLDGEDGGSSKNATIRAYKRSLLIYKGI